jgi:hypothetical protein
MSSFDWIPPGLQDQLVELRGPHTAAFDHLWRTERMVRYAYWLRGNGQATFNLFGSWTRADMEAEIAFWSAFGHGAESDEIVVAGEAQIQARYEIDQETAVGLTSRLELATRHLPIWNAATRSLVPQVLGSFRILGATDNETSNPGLGHTIRFQPEAGGRYLDLYIYGRSETAVPEGARNAEVQKEFSAVSRDIGTIAASRGLSLVSNHVAEIETLVLRRLLDSREPCRRDSPAHGAFDSRFSGAFPEDPLYRTRGVCKF